MTDRRKGAFLLEPSLFPLEFLLAVWLLHRMFRPQARAPPEARLLISFRNQILCSSQWSLAFGCFVNAVGDVVVDCEAGGDTSRGQPRLPSLP